MESLPYTKIPDYPKQYTASSILIRLLDGLGFRYRWATEGLTESDYMFRPSPDSMSVKELLSHINYLVNMVDYCFGGEKPRAPADTSLHGIRFATLSKVLSIRTKLVNMSPSQLQSCKYHSDTIEADFPIWNIVNGPICDALTHVGQLNSWRRLNGNPVQAANVFLGTPPQSI